MIEEKNEKDIHKLFCEQTEEFQLLQRAFSTLNLKLNTLQDICRLLLKNSLDEILNDAMNIIMNTVNVESASLLLVDEEKKDLYFKVAKGPKASDVMQYRLKMGEGIAGWVALHNQVLSVSDVKRDHRFKKEISEKIGYDVRSILCVPVQIKGRVIGVIEIINKFIDDVYTADDTDLLSSCANVIAIIIEHFKNPHK